jgi:hypothetical protein
LAHCSLGLQYQAVFDKTTQMQSNLSKNNILWLNCHTSLANLFSPHIGGIQTNVAKLA